MPDPENPDLPSEIVESSSPEAVGGEQIPRKEAHDEILDVLGDVEIEQEKEIRDELRKILFKRMSETLRPLGFKKTASSVWSRKNNGRIEMIYLQRSNFGHEYFIEFGFLDEKTAERLLPGAKPNLDLFVKCALKDRKLIEQIVSELEGRGRIGYTPGAGVLDFNDPSKPKFYQNTGLTGRTVSREVALGKIEEAQRLLAAYTSLWFKA